MADLPKFRTQAQWQSRNPILGSGEPGFDEDTGKVKIGDGHTHWNDLPYRDDLAPYTLPAPVISELGVSQAEVVQTIAQAGSYDAVILADKPVGFWPLSAGLTTVADKVGSNTATFTGTPGVSAMPNGDAAVTFDGITQYLTVPDADNFSVPKTGQLTLEVWIRPDVYDFPNPETSTDGPLVYPLYKGNRTGPGGNIEYCVRMYSRNSTRPNRTSSYVFNPEGGLGAGSYAEDVLTSGQWMHLVAVFDGVNKGADGWGTVTLYKNGVQRDQDSWGDPYNIVPVNGDSPIYLGGRPGHSYFKGGMGKVAIYGKALTAQQIAAHYAAMQSEQVPAPVGSLAAWNPVDNGLIAAAFDPAAIGSNSPLLNGTVIFVKVPIRQPATISKVWYGFNAAGAGLTAGQNLVGVYDSSGALIGTCPDQTTAFGAVGAHSAVVTPVAGKSLAIAGSDLVYVGFLANGTTPPTLWRSGSQNAGNNIGLAAGAYRFGSIGTGQTALPTSIALASAASVSAFWAGVS
jgi:hypothetical protein